MPTRILRRGGEIAALAFAYYLTARLGLLLAIPPGYATPIYPPAGIALAAVLVFGYRIAPGIWLGSFLANVATAFDPTSTAALVRSLLLPLGIGAGATLQAVAGAALIRGTVGYPTPLHRERDVVKFLALGGPISCLIAASAGVSALLVAGSLPAVSYGFSWWTWWVGDTIGVLIVTPLALIGLGKPRDAWRRRLNTVAVPLCMALAGIIAVFFGARESLAASQPSLITWAVLAAGLASTCLLGAFLLVVSGHAMLFERLLQEGTAELEARRQAEEALRRERSQVQAILDNAPVFISIRDLQGRMVLANRSFVEAIDGAAPPQFIGKSGFNRFSRDVAEPLSANDLAAREADGPVRVEEKFRLNDGSWRTHLTVRFPVRYLDSEEPFGICAIATDITERKRAEEALRESEALFKLAVDIAQLGFWEWDVATNAVYWSPLFKQQLGYEDHEIEAKVEEWASRLHPEERDRVFAYLAAHEGEKASEREVEYRLRHRDGSYRWFLVRGMALSSPAEKRGRWVGTHLDITERKDAEQRMRYAAQHDALTGLPNRTLIHEVAEHLLGGAGRGRRAAVLFIDLDRFKPINDTYGHEIGDEVLKEVARRLKSSLRAEDAVGRLGGDEFIAVVSQVHNAGEAAKAASQLMTSLSRPYEVGGLALETSPSIGISLFPADGADLDTLLRKADIAMYHAKRSGRGNFQFFTAALNASIARATQIETRLRVTLKQHEFVLHYQPIVDFESGLLIGAEALLRWPDRAIGPDAFIPVAETSGLIHELSAWVIDAACRQLAKWQECGLAPLTMSINISPLELRHPAFVTGAARALAAHALPPGCVQFEIHQGALTKDFDAAIAILRLLKAQGIRIAIDDFGQGSSNLIDLGRLAPDAVKIDRALVAGLAADSVASAFIGGLVGIGHTLGLHVIAQGIESPEALATLRATDCREMQGNHLCPPVPADEFERWCRDWQAPWATTGHRPRLH